MNEKIEAEAVSIVPVIPHSFFGTVMVNGKPAPAGCVVTARVAGQAAGVCAGNPRISEALGWYAKAGMMEEKLYVQGNIVEGAPITFFVDGAPAQCMVAGGAWAPSFPFAAGGVTGLSLRAGMPAYEWMWMRMA